MDQQDNHWRRSVLRRSRTFAVVFMFFVIIPQLICAIMSSSLGEAIVHGGFVWMWLLFPCSDHEFGNGKKMHWIRQAVIVVSGVIVFMVALV